MLAGIIGGALLLVLLILILPSIRMIGPTEVGLVTKRFGFKSLSEDNPVGFEGEAGYQADLLMPGWRWMFWIVYAVGKYPWVQVPAGEIGVVVAQVGDPLLMGAKSAEYKKELGNFQNLRTFVKHGGQKGVQRPVLPPGTLAPIHPVGFLVITRDRVYGSPISPELTKRKQGVVLSPEDLGLDRGDLNVVVIEPKEHKAGDFDRVPTFIEGGDSASRERVKESREVRKRKVTDVIGIITTFEGAPLLEGDIASRLGGFSDIQEMELGDSTDAELIESIIGAKNASHNNYQDFQTFLDGGGKIGLQHDPLLYGAYLLNPFLVKVDIVPMLVIEQGEVAVIKSYVGLVTKDVSGEEFKYGSLVRPGHRGIWQEPLRTGKYPINPHCYQAEVVPTAILTLNWADAVSEAHHLDSRLRQISGKSREGFVFNVDLQVLIHVPDTRAPYVISMVGTVQNLIEDILQSAVGNHFRDKLQSMEAVKFIETRQMVQEEAYAHISEKLVYYDVETVGVYIQDVVFPEELVQVLTKREIANQEIETYKKQEAAQSQRILMEKSMGTADMQKELAESQVGVNIASNKAEQRKHDAAGEATYIRETGAAKGAEVEAIGLARAKAYREQVAALGQESTAMVNMIGALSEGGLKFVPDVMVSGDGDAMGGLAGTLMKRLSVGPSKGEVAPQEEERERPQVKVEEPETEVEPEAETEGPELRGVDY